MTQKYFEAPKKILYAVQGTGNGHISRAREIYPILCKYGEVDVLVSGTQSELSLPFKIKYKCNGLSFYFGKNGGIDYLQTFRKSNIRKLINDIKSIPVGDYDIVISDFEPISAWACKLQKKICVGLSHQIAVSNKNSPKPKKTDFIGKSVLANYAPTTLNIGFHFKQYDKNIFTPIISSAIRECVPTIKKHYTVYLPSYSDKRIFKVLSNIEEVEWHVFSKKCAQAYTKKNILFYPINYEKFVKSIVSCKGVICGAGFETPAEAIYLQKKLVVIPMKGQYEQQCNAAALKEMGVLVLKKLNEKQIKELRNWAAKGKFVKIEYKDNLADVVDYVINECNQIEKQTEKKLDIKESSFIKTIKRILRP